MAGEYSLLDEETLNRLNMQNQGTPTLTGVPSPSTAIPAISPELMAFGEKIGTPKPESTLMEKLGKGLGDISPLLTQMGTSLMRGRNMITGAPTETVGSQMGQIISSALISQKMNEATKKMIAAQLAGRGGGVGGGAGFSEGQPIGFTGGEVAGLSPEQISGLYGAGLGLRAAELKRPFEEMKSLSESYLHVMTGEAKPAEIEQHLANAQKIYQDLAKAPFTTELEWDAKIQAMRKVEEDIKEVQARTAELKEKPETARLERKKTIAETAKAEKQTAEITARLDPKQVRMLEFAKTVGWKAVERGNVIELRDEASGALMTTLQVGAKPETATKTKAEEIPLKKFAMQRIAPLVVPRLEAELAAMPGGKQKIDLQNLISSLRGYTGEIDPGVLLAKSSPELQDKFNKLMDIYIKTPGLSETEFGNIVQGMVGKGAAPAAAPTAKLTTGKPVTEKYKPATTAPPSEGLSTSQISQIEDQARRDKKPNAVYESQGWRVEVRGGKVINITPKKAGSEVPNNPYGTF